MALASALGSHASPPPDGAAAPHQAGPSGDRVLTSVRPTGAGDRRGLRPPVSFFAGVGGGLLTVLLVVIGGGATWAGAAAPPAPPPRVEDEAEAVLAAVRREVPAFRATPSQWFRVELRRPIRLLRGARVYAITRLTIPETHGLVALGPDGRASLLGSDWTGPCAAKGFNALVDAAQVKLEAPHGATAFVRAYLALMHIGGARLVERLEDIADPDTDEYREYERDVMDEVETNYRGLVRPVLREPRPDGSGVSFYVWVKSELQRWQLVVNAAGQVTACEFLRVAGVPSDHIP